MVHELSRNKESLPHSLRIESLPISTFIRGHFGLKFPLKKIPKQRVHWLLKASRFQSGKNAESLAVPPPRPADTRGQHTRWWAGPQQLGLGVVSEPAARFGESSRLLAFDGTHPPPGIATLVLRWAPAARPSAAWGILQLTGWALSQTKAWPLPGPIKPPAFPAFQPSLSLGVAN